MTKALEGVRGQRHAPAVLYPGKDPVPIVQEAGWATGPVWTGAENLATTGIRSPDRQPVASRYTDCATRPTGSEVLIYYNQQCLKVLIKANVGKSR
jgi:hypothetical protein